MSNTVPPDAKTGHFFCCLGAQESIEDIELDVCERPTTLPIMDNLEIGDVKWEINKPDAGTITMTLVSRVTGIWPGEKIAKL